MTMALDRSRNSFARETVKVPFDAAQHVAERFGKHIQDALVVASRPNFGRRLVDWALHPVSSEVDVAKDESLRQLGSATLASTLVGRAWSAAFHCTDYGQTLNFGGVTDVAYANSIPGPYHPVDRGLPSDPSQQSNIGQNIRTL
jgi:hypothetical protein